jgi:hypothetical protein
MPILTGPYSTWQYWTYDQQAPNKGIFSADGMASQQKEARDTTSIQCVADDGVWDFGKCGGKLTSAPFTNWVYPSPVRELDNYKYWILNRQPAAIPPNGQVRFEWEASVQTSHTDQSPFPAAVLQGEDDLRLAAGVFGLFDDVRGNAYSFALTNDRVYALYQRLPFNRTVSDNYAAFTYAVPVAERTPADFHRMAIIVKACCPAVSWLLEGKQVFRVKAPGFRLTDKRLTPIIDNGGVEGDSTVSAIKYGLGTMTFVNAYPAAASCRKRCGFPPIREALVDTGSGDAYTVEYNPVTGAPTLATYWDPQGTSQYSHVWGQGVTIRITHLKVTKEPCTCPILG